MAIADVERVRFGLAVRDDVIVVVLECEVVRDIEPDAVELLDTLDVVVKEPLAVAVRVCATVLDSVALCVGDFVVRALVVVVIVIRVVEDSDGVLVCVSVCRCDLVGDVLCVEVGEPDALRLLRAETVSDEVDDADCVVELVLEEDFEEDADGRSVGAAVAVRVGNRVCVEHGDALALRVILAEKVPEAVDVPVLDVVAV